MGFFGQFGNPSAKIKFCDNEYTQESVLVFVSGVILFIALYLKYGLTWRVFSVLPISLISAYKVECMQVGSCFAFAQYISLLNFIISITIIINIFKNRKN